MIALGLQLVFEPLLRARLLWVCDKLDSPQLGRLERVRFFSHAQEHAMT